jgi:hypothetical protein
MAWQLTETSRKQTTGSAKNPGPSVIASIAFCFLLVALYPAWVSSRSTADGPGVWMDSSFCGLLAGAVLQTLNLGLQILGPLLLPRTFHIKLQKSTRALVAGFGALTVVLTALSILLYGSASAPWSGMIAFAGQATNGLVQLLLVFGS